MKQLKVSEKQAERLVKMADTLLAEKGYKWIYDSDNFGILFLGRFNKIPKIEIHWFELCVTKLANKVFHNAGKKGKLLLTGQNFHIFNDRLTQTWTGFGWKEVVDDKVQKIHPIDYLYKVFKTHEL